MQEVREIINNCKEDILKRIGADNLIALILVGSFARGEAVTYQDNGKLRLLSDIEFLAVAKPNSFTRLKNLKNIKATDYKVSLGFTTQAHLKRLKPYIFTIELKKFGKVLWGGKDILGHIPDYKFEDIDFFDGFILLNNRIVEQLILLERIEVGEAVYGYDFYKGYIQLVNSILVFNKRYKSLYVEKKEELVNLFPTMKYLKDSAPELLEKARQALDLVNSADFKSINPDEAMLSWNKLRDITQKVWLYESRVLLKKDCGLEEAIEKFIALPSLKNRLKGWIKAMKKKRFNLAYIFKTSPQFMIYKIAVRQYFSKERNKKERRKIISFWESLVK